MKRVSVLGCGWLGKSLSISLLDEGYSVKGSTTTEEKLELLEMNNITPYIVNISEFEEFDSFLNSDILIISITSKDLDGFQNLISQIESSDVQKVIFISSTSVYGRLNKVMTEEDVVLKTPLTEIEDLFRQNNFFETTIIRFAGLFGYNRKPGNFFKDGKIIPDPKGFVNMIHQDDCVLIILKIIENEIWGEIFNACTDSHPTREEFYTKAKKEIGVESPKFDNSTFSPFKIVSNTKIKKYLNYTFKYPNLLEVDYNSHVI